MGGGMLQVEVIILVEMYVTLRGMQYYIYDIYKRPTPRTSEGASERGPPRGGLPKSAYQSPPPNLQRRAPPKHPTVRNPPPLEKDLAGLPEGGNA